MVSGSAAEEVRRLKAASGKDMVVWGSLTLADSLMRDGLVDEYRLQVCPVVLGRGKRLFEEGLALDSVILVELISFIEKRFQIELGDDALSTDTFRNLQSIARVIREQMALQHAETRQPM